MLVWFSFCDLFNAESEQKNSFSHEFLWALGLYIHFFYSSRSLARFNNQQRSMTVHWKKFSRSCHHRHRFFVVLLSVLTGNDGIKNREEKCPNKNHNTISIKKTSYRKENKREWQENRLQCDSSLQSNRPTDSSKE